MNEDSERLEQEMACLLGERLLNEAHALREALATARNSAEQIALLDQISDWRKKKHLVKQILGT